MPVASKSSVSSHKRHTSSSSQTVQFSERLRAQPLWLIRLCYLQRRFCAVSWLLMIAMVTVYGLRGYSQQKWNQANTKLENLQLEERQLMRNNEVLKEILAIQAHNPQMGLVAPNPADAIVLQPVSKSVQANKSIHQTSVPSAKNNSSTSIPLSY